MINYFKKFHFHKYEILDMMEDSIFKKCKICGKVIVERYDMTGMDIFTYTSSEQECINYRNLVDIINSDSIRLELIKNLKNESIIKFYKRRTK